MIRPATKDDLSAIDYIYNQAIYAGFCTAHLHPVDEQERRAWFKDHSEHKYPIYVYENDGEVLGWAALSPYRKGREALRETAELSYYVDFKHHGQDIGTQLVQHCLDECSKLNKRVLIAIIIDGNDASIGLLEKFGFSEWGYLPETIKYEGEVRGQRYMGKVVE
ncbi:GNAT family N-acetyltransferase [Aliifodinibius sp. S!AR15-10]|uniref:GNAT family N-acetyltransferase n=1 Tax=Aliifodinibius sp. S!AR15-10 TaxID=2950437 RepID=UPI00285EA47F|nr:GNAT family N-acetyltransferase [Aliifodinibius sp. S!AR15-10]MDR8391629.1 GNAT family N-acetyltransferase [Aliifodinibius sp. S!AR15-10]